MQRRKSLQLFRILLFLLFGILALADGKDESKAASVFSWLTNDKHFFLNPKLGYNDGTFHVKKRIKASEVLLVIPSSFIVVAQQADEEEDDHLCELLHALWKEIELGETSSYVPYVEYLLAAQSNRTRTPALWSNIGRRLLNMVSITLPRSHITNWIDGFDECIEALLKTDSCNANNPESCMANEEAQEDQDDENTEVGEDGSLITHEVDALEYSEEQKAHRNAFDITIQHHIDQRFLVPLYDQIPHHHFDHNVVHQVQADNSIQVLASKDIAAGEQLQRKSLTCLKDCESKNNTVTSTLRNYGQVQNYPQYWNFPIGVSFIYDPFDKEPLQWIKGPFAFWNVEIMENEYSRQLRIRTNDIHKSRQSIPDIEWKQIDAYSYALTRALQVAIADSYEIFEGEDHAEMDEEGEDEDADEGRENEEEENSEAEVEESDEPVEEDIEEGDEYEYECDNACFDRGVPTNATGCEEAECYLGDIAEMRGCPDYKYDAVLNETEWVLMRSAYIAIVGPRKATIKLHYRSGMKVEYRVGFSPGRGRGVFSVRDIPKGTLVWTSENTAAFETGVQYRTFLRTLPDFMVCDLLIWCYTSKDKKYVLFLSSTNRSKTLRQLKSIPNHCLFEPQQSSFHRLRPGRRVTVQYM